MAHEHEATEHALTLPVLVFGLPEVHRLQRELEALEQYVRQETLRGGDKAVTLPRTSRLLEALATDNQRDLLQASARKQLSVFLQQVVQQAPMVHISFAADPSSAFTAKVVAWLRGNIHPQALLQLGLQPSIAAGCVVRTANKTFDFSLRERLKSQESALATALQGAIK